MTFPPIPNPPRKPKRWLRQLLQFGTIGAVLLLTVGCGQEKSPIASQSPTTSAPTSPAPSATPSPTSSSPGTVSARPQASTKLKATSGLVSVNIYHPDDQCNQFIATPKKLPKNDTLDAAIETVLQDSNTADFSVSSYRVQVKDHQATIELRLPPNSKRQFQSLSSCEQMALFGSLEKTLTSRSEWGIQDVKFTDGKKEIVL